MTLQRIGVVTLGAIGLVLTAFGTIVAIEIPRDYGRFAADDWRKRERWTKARCFVGIGMIFVGTVVQVRSSFG